MITFILAAIFVILIIALLIVLALETVEFRKFRAFSDDVVEHFNELIESYAEVVKTVNGNANESNDHLTLTAEHDKKIDYILTMLDVHSQALQIYAPFLKHLKPPESTGLED